MRLAKWMCWCVWAVACDRAPMQPISPSGPTPVAGPTSTPVAEQPILEAPTARADAEPILEVPTIAPEPEPEPAANEPTTTEPSRDATEIPESSQTSDTCCRTCRKGKACGDTCVARDRECTVAPGCACDAR
jgi:hypothetical protein